MASKELNLQSVSALLTEDILKQVIDKIYKKKQVSPVPNILSSSVKYACDKGDGYMGIVYRIKIKLSDNSNCHIIGKSMPENIVRRKTFESYTFFASEVYFFNVVLPKFRELELKQRGIEQESLLSLCDCYYATADGDNDFLLLEDLCEDGYAMFDRSQDLNSVYTNSLLKVIARFHAFSYALKHHDNAQFQRLKEPIREVFLSKENEKRLGKYMINLAQLFHRAIKDILQNTDYLQKFEKFIDEKCFYKNILKTLELKEPAVINHGDCWITNFMFKHHGAASKAIDFQIIRYGSPILDFSIFIFSCMTKESLEHLGGVNSLLRVYYDELCSAVAALKAPLTCVPTWDELRNLWRECGLFGFVAALELVPLTLVEHEDVQDLDTVEGTDAVPLEDLTHFTEITKDSDRNRLADLIKLAVDSGML